MFAALLVHVYLLSIATISNGQKTHWQGSTWTNYEEYTWDNYILDCIDGIDCCINCFTTGACYGIEIHGPKDATLTINCNSANDHINGYGTTNLENTAYPCGHSTVYADESTQLYINVYNLGSALNGMQIYTPITPTVNTFITCGMVDQFTPQPDGQPSGGSVCGQNNKIYSKYGFSTVRWTYFEDHVWALEPISAGSSMYCGENYLDSCSPIASGEFVNCDDGLSQCVFDGTYADQPNTHTCAAGTEEEEQCPIDDTTTFNWDTLTSDGVDIPQVSFTMDIDSLTLSLEIEVEVEYIVRAYADDQAKPNFGTTYVLDFEDFNAHKSNIALPGSCSNRLAAHYNGDSSTYFTINSQGIDAIGSTENMCYPPPGDDITGWSINTDEMCTRVKYSGKWTWGDLRECTNGGGLGGKQTFIIGETDPNYDPNYLALSGTFYINIVSPYWYENNDNYGGFYRVYQLVSQPFIIQVSKSVYVIGSTGINVMTMSIIAVYKEDQDSDYTLILLTETAEYMMLGTPQLMEPLTIGTATLNILETAETGAGNDACLNNKAYLCSQLWKIEAIDVTCNTNYDGITGGIDFGGTYQVKFDPICRNDNIETTYNENSYCNNWLNNHPEFDVTNGEYKGVVLQSNLVFMDEICEAKTFTVQLEADMYFYEEPNIETGVIEWTNIIGPTSDYLYQVGESTIYSEIVLDFPIDTEIIFGSTLVNVWLCTFPPFPQGETVPPPNQNGPTIPVDAATNGGCFSSERDEFIDGSSSDFFFHIFSSQAAIKTEGFALIDDGLTETNKIKFTFLCPHEIQRDTLYVHAQVEVLLQELGGATRRMLLNTAVEKKTANKFAHFGKNIGITNNQIENKPKQPPLQIPPQQPLRPPPSMTEPFTISLNSSWVLFIGGLLAVILTLNIIFMCYMNCCKSSNGRRNGYDSVKHIDSEEFDDSEANLINVN